jgi:pteridine reductase
MGRPLEGRTALVTGGGVRIGRAIALHLGRLGANVAVHFHSSAAGAEEVVRTLAVDGNRAAALKADLCDAAALGPLLERARRELGPLSILVNSAGLLGERADLDTLWKLNAKAPYLLTEAFAAAAPEGSDVVNIVDIYGLYARWTSELMYTMTKAALAEATKAFAVMLAPRIRVNAVAPGVILPTLPQLTGEDLEHIKKRTPLKRFGEADEVAQAVGMLITGPHFVTGQILSVDGGRSLA